jgi:hypothetical protein
MASPHIMCASLSEVELTQTPTNKAERALPMTITVSEKQHSNVEFSPSAKLVCVLVLLFKHHIMQAYCGIRDKAPHVLSLRLKSYEVR